MKKVTTQIARVQEAAAISVGQIILDNSHYLTIWGYLQTADGWKRCDFVTNYEVLNNMFRAMEEKSEAVQMAIVQKLEQMQDGPELIDLEAQFGAPVVFDNIRFSLSKPHYTREDEWVDYVNEYCFYIDSAEVLPAPAAPYTEEIGNCMSQLAQCYSLYLGYLELEFDEASARQDAALTDDVKFTLAYYAWKQEGN
ncbi:hypothetical protein MKQ68_19480 [Chitinophaga horti]|uniref:Uncharacterized protein n=1 Tax=Chitinophaga horti TaxID=2920382 RepID=A0ABY6IY12_9BACT|nr:hypothetical protein [Chitinophaga horti]UYQ92271.1 hypothetical protein MKQ68_19480 [Chitinophaga horti]